MLLMTILPDGDAVAPPLVNERPPLPRVSSSPTLDVVEPLDTRSLLSSARRLQ
jgi:hypothetical protein